MPDLQEGQSVEVQGSAATPYVLKNVGGVYSCSCPAWRNQSLPIDRRTCKHLRRLRGDAAEEARVGIDSATRFIRLPVTASETVKPPPLLLAETWDHETDVTGWAMSEKLDGVRAYWDGRQFLSRNGNRYHAPDWFVDGLPDVPLDGELWIGRKMFQRTVSIVRRQAGGDLWREVRFVVFDAPACPDEFETRLDFLADCLGQRQPPFVRLLEHDCCLSLGHLHAELARIERLGGEGLMLRRPGSKYESGRSPTLLKVKRFRDAEAVVVAYQAGFGRHRGRVGALVLRLPNGTRFYCGTGLSDAERSAPPPIGSVVTYRFQELTDAGLPRFPSFVRVRHDIPAQPTHMKRKELAPCPPLLPFDGSSSARDLPTSFGRSA